MNGENFIQMKQTPMTCGISTILKFITLVELQSTLQQLSNGKASGPNDITYENLKHLHLTILKLILTLFNVIIKSHKNSKDWNIALLYPIPKAISFDHNIENTCPIALLDCIQKLFLKIFTNC